MTEREWAVLEILKEEYGDIGSGLRFKNAFELLIATILSAQSTDVRVNMVTETLFQKYPGPTDFLQLTEEALAKEIASIGLYRSKSKNILKTCHMLVSEHQGQVPADRTKLEKLAGVGRKTANVVLCNAFHEPAFAVDTHVFRVTNRLGFAHHKTVVGVEQQVTASLPPSLWCDSHHWFIWHGRGPCKARNPLCGKCPVGELCPWPERVDYQ